MFARIRRNIDRWRHQSRHRRAKERLRLLGRPRSILVICRGNVCRSPYLAALLQQWLPDVEVKSAGLVARGQSVPEHAATVAARRALDLRSHSSRVVTREMIAGAQLVIVMEPGQADYINRRFGLSSERIVVAGDLDLVSNERAIRDPVSQPIEVFEASYRRLDRCAAVMADVFSTLL